MNEVESFRVLKVLVRGIAWYIDNLGIVIPISFISVMPELLCYLIFAFADPEEGVYSAGAFETQLVSFLAGVWLVGFLTHAAVSSMRSGRKPSLNDSLSHSARVYFPLVLLSLLLGLVMFLGFKVPFLLWFALMSQGPGRAGP